MIRNRYKQRSQAFIPGLLLLFVLLFPVSPEAGMYLNSAHGDSSYGVKRAAAGFPDYTRGLCEHCHEQHASIGGAEPVPAGGAPSGYLLFYDNYVSQTDGLCLQCHRNLNSLQTGGSIINRSYSYRAGGWTADPVDDILTAFSFTSPDSSHNLDDIGTFITGRWGYTANSNPCAACHNPHALQGDPADSGNSPKTAVTRGWPVSRPSSHSTDNNSWGLWGDGPGENIDDYAPGGYQAPYRFNSTIIYEPDGSATQDGSNLTDFVSFCTDCHNDINTISSTPLARNLYTVDWATEKHGSGLASDACVDVFPPYQPAQCGNYILACTDCHEPHGSPNIFLVRKEVNGSVVTVDTGTAQGPGGMANAEWTYLCEQCHDGLQLDGYHTHPDIVPSIPPEPVCSSLQCHLVAGDFRPCGECHFHSNDEIDGVPYGEPLF
jgi:hypothetical protein